MSNSVVTQANGYERGARLVAEVRADIQVRSIKLALSEDVDIGWSVVNTREIVRQEVAATDTRGILPHHLSTNLGDIRVIDTIKELGELSLQ